MLASGNTLLLRRSSAYIVSRQPYHAFTSSTAAAAAAAAPRVPEIRPLSASEAAFWEQVLSKITKPQLAEMRRIINPQVPLGLDEAYLQGVSRRVQLHQYFLDCKKECPESVVLVQVGAFYEASGIDALVLAQFANMNLMSQAKAVIPKAGFPLDQLPLHVFTLNQEGLSVVVASEAGPKSTKGVGRKIDFVSTPARPRFFEPPALDVDGMSALPPKPVPPMIGIARSRHGFTLFTMHRDTMLATSMTGLTQEGLFCKIYGTGYATPVFLHDSTLLDPRSRSDIVSFTRRTASVQFALTADFTGQDPEQGFLAKVKQHMFSKELQGGADVAIRMVRRDKRHRRVACIALASIVKRACRAHASIQGRVTLAFKRVGEPG